MRSTFRHSYNAELLFWSLVFLISAMGSASAQYTVASYSFATTTGIVLENVTTYDGLLLNSNNDDVATPVFNLPFTFNYCGTNYSQYSVSSNGLMSLGATAVPTTATNSLVGTNSLKLAPYWDDVSTGTTGNVVYKTIGVSPNRKFVIDWYLRIPKSTTAAANCHIQCWLEEATSAISFVYGSIPANTGQYTVGLSNSTTDFISVTTSTNTAGSVSAVNSNTVAIASGRMYRFVPALPACVNAVYPANGATGVPPMSSITWAGGSSGGAPTSYDVYFGATSTPPLVSSGQTATSYTPSGLLNLNTVYYWKVVPKNATGSTSNCSVNSFTSATTLSYDVSRQTGVTYNSLGSAGNTVSAWKYGSSTDDNLSQSIPIGFNFPFSGGACTELLVSTNGFITFNTSTTSNGGNSASYTYQNTGFSATDNTKSVAVLAPFWDDLTCQGNPGILAGLNASIRFLTTGSAPSRVFTVEWISMETPLIQGADLNFQVKLYETSGVIEFVYGTMVGFFGNINPGTSPSYSYSLGINAWNITSGASVGEVFSQQVHNTRYFKDSTAKAVNNLFTVPACNSRITFTPGSYVAYTSPTSTIPGNDAPTAAYSMAVNSTPCTNFCGGIFSTAGATSSGIAVASGGGVADDDVWFKFIATDPSITIKAIGGTNFDPSLEIFSGLPTNATTRISNSNTTATGYSESVTLNSLTVGTTYYFRVFHYGVGYAASSALGGDFAVCIYKTPLAPLNDNCSGALALTVGATCAITVGNSMAATGSTGYPVCSAVSPDPAPNPDDDVWFSFVAVMPIETITVQSGFKYNAVVQVFSGTCGSLTSLNCTNASKNSQAEVVPLSGLIPGNTYYIRVYQYTYGAGRGDFTICVTANVPSCATGLYPPSPTSNVPATGITLRWNSVAEVTGYDVYLDTSTVAPASTLVASNVVDTFYTTGSLGKGLTYNYRIAPRNGVGSNTSCYTSVFAVEPYGFNLIIKAYLQGFYLDTGTMRATINPMDTITDSLRVKLYNTTAPYTLQYATTALLSTHGLALAEFPQPALQRTYYIAIENRNHLETWSSVPFYFGTPDTTYDFSASVSSAYGNNLTQLSPGVFGIYGGDVNQDDSINLTDLLTVGAGCGVFYSLYRPEDINGDQLVESADYSLMEAFFPLGKYLLRP